MKAVVKFLLSIGALILCFTPTWLFLFFYYALTPNGFWQKFAIFGVGVYILGLFQLILIILFIYILCIILDK